MNLKIPPGNPFDRLTETRPSAIHGFGVFARVDIPSGTVWWRALPGNHLLINEEQFRTLKTSAQSAISTAFIEAFQTYAYFSGPHNALVFLLDNARFTNHSDKPNSALVPDQNVLASYTLRDIVAGEELLEDYSTYDPCPWTDLYEEIIDFKN